MKSGASTKRAFVTYSEVRYSFFRAGVPSGVSDCRCSLSKHPPAPALCQHRHREGERSGVCGEWKTDTLVRVCNPLAQPHRDARRRSAQHEAIYRATHHAAVDTLIATWKAYYFETNIAKTNMRFEDNMNTYICNSFYYIIHSLTCG